MASIERTAASRPADDSGRPATRRRRSSRNLFSGRQETSRARRRKRARIYGGTVEDWQGPRHYRRIRTVFAREAFLSQLKRSRRYLADYRRDGTLESRGAGGSSRLDSILGPQSPKAWLDLYRSFPTSCCRSIGRPTGHDPLVFLPPARPPIPQRQGLC